MTRLAALALLGLLACYPARADPVPDDLGARVTDGYARPAAQAFTVAARETARLTGELCAVPGGESLGAARAAFAGLVPAWGGLSVLRFGPLQAENRYERLFFWPDPRGVIVRQVGVLLAGKDEAALAPGALAARSVAVQGLPALEFALHGAGAGDLETEAGGYRCRYALAVATNVADIAAAVEVGWDEAAPFHDDFAAPAAGNDLYRSQREVAGEIVKALGTALQFTRNAELLPPLGETPDKARGKRAPLWRSGLTFALAAARIEAAVALLDAAGFAGDAEARGAVETMRFDLAHAAEALRAVTTPAEDAFAPGEDRERIRYATVALDAANATLGEKLSAALGLTMGFNALDGD
ncbi:MAG: imelysin family protein [Aquamicrobium sp.]|uniref:imelysin family protein n=1 Tax=Aquamicrobium sp. TaxID=1872579 RepID=UPI00349EE7D8|nr:imelysin family protein [Aquamicrobium sp.]